MKQEIRIHRRPGQHKDETAMEYLRRVVHNLSYEPEGNLECLPSVEAVLDYFDLWKVYDTDLWEGVLESIADGESSAPARAFIAKYNLNGWLERVRISERVAKEAAKEEAAK